MKEYTGVMIVNSVLLSGIPGFRSVYPANVKHTRMLVGRVGPCEISGSVYSKSAASVAANNDAHELLWTRDEQHSTSLANTFFV
jgi:hypothetical protein